MFSLQYTVCRQDSFSLAHTNDSLVEWYHRTSPTSLIGELRSCDAGYMRISAIGAVDYSTWTPLVRCDNDVWTSDAVCQNGRFPVSRLR